MTPWHPSIAQLKAWVTGSIGAVDAASVEQHVPVCETCRTLVADAALDDAVGTPELDAVWHSIRDRIEPQALNLVGRTLVRLGMSRGNAFLVSSAPSLSSAWVLGVTLALLFAVAAAGTADTRGIGMFLLIAPLAPLAGIAFAYGSESDPLYELTLAAPYAKFQLLLWRSAAVLATTIPITVIGGVLVLTSWWLAAVWLVPALAFAALALALTRWLQPHVTATGIAVVWVAIQAEGVARRDPLAAVSAEALLLYAAVGIAAVVVFVLMRSRTDTFSWRLP